LKNTKIEFTVEVRIVEETIPANILPDDTATFLADLKSKAYDDLAKGAIVVTADTTVIQQEKVLGKPKNREQARQILLQLSGQTHKVITGVCVRQQGNRDIFSVSTEVYFDTLTETEIAFYIDHYHPFDKAGAYGIQEWIGHIGVRKIDGSYYNVMGLPIQQLYQRLKKYQV
jgi:septum formation protein